MCRALYLKIGYTCPGTGRRHQWRSRGVSAGTRYGHPASFGRAYGLSVASSSAKRQAMAPTGECARARATPPLSPALSCSHGKKIVRAGTAGAVRHSRRSPAQPAQSGTAGAVRHSRRSRQDRAGPARTLPAVARGSDLVPRVCCSCGSSS